MSTALELKSCPFCGGEAAIEQTGRQELTLRCVGLQPSGLYGCGPKFVQKVKTHSLEWLAEYMAGKWNQREPRLDDGTMQKLREALRFSASRSVMSSDDEARILGVFSAQNEVAP